MMSDDQSPGDARQPYSDVGGPAGRHARTHDVRAENRSNPKGAEPVDTSFAERMAPNQTGGPGGHQAESVSGVDDKVLHAGFPELSNDELARLSVLEPGTALEQGGIYVDLNNLANGPFKAMAGHETTKRDRIIAKRDTDYELWNRIVGQDVEPELERPANSD
jgi:hypothetical protein